MRSRAKTALGIDIGGRQVSLALVRKDGLGFQVVAAARGTLPASPSGADQESESRESARTKVLSKLLSRIGGWTRLRGVKAALALSADSLVLQLLDLPKHMPTNIGDFVQEELQQYVALSGRNVVSDFCGAGSSVRKRLLAVAGDADEIQAMVRTCGAARIAVEAVEPSALAYARTFLSTDRDRDATIALLGPRTLTVCLFRGGTMDLVRVRTLPADADTSQSLGGWLARELKEVARYHDSQASGAGHDRQTRVVIHDGVHEAAELSPWLTAETTDQSLTVVDAGEPWADSSPAQDGSPMEASAAAVGAALTLLGVGDNLKINLLPQGVAEARSFVRHLLLTANVGVIVFLGVFVATHFLMRTTRAMGRRIEQTRLAQELYTTPALLAKERFFDQEISRLRQRRTPLRKILAGRPETDWAEVLGAVRQAGPTGVTIAQLQSSEGTTLSLKGFASSCPAAQLFVHNLEEQGLFESVELASVQRQQDAKDRLEYRIDCLLKAKGGDS